MTRTSTEALGLIAVSLLLTAGRAGAQNGPGGVGATDGSSHLQLWLDASRGTYQTSAGTAAASADGDPIGRWEDRSGRGRNVTQSTAGRRPALRLGSNGLNGHAVTAYDNTSSGNEDFLRSATISPALAQPFTLFGVARKIGSGTTAQTIIDSRTAGTNTMVLGYSGATQARINATSDVTATLTQGSFAIIRGVYNGTSSSIAVDGGTATTGNAGTRTADGFTVGGNRSSAQFLNGEIAELIHFDTTLLAAETIIVENYLAAKYGIAISNDYYGSASHTTDVAGIGRESDGVHDLSASAGLVVASNGSLNANGEYLLFGHEDAPNAASAQDLPTGVILRWERTWYLDKTGTLDGGDVRIGFDFSDAGISATPGSASDYRLLRRAGTSGPFSTVTAASTQVVGDQVIFEVADASLQDGYFTIGTTLAESPLPVELLFFDVKQGEGGIELAWRTASERDNAGFTLSRRETTAGEPEPIASYRSHPELVGAGTSALGRGYRFVDRDRLAAGVTYEYRLQSVRADGSTDEPVLRSITTPVEAAGESPELPGGWSGASFPDPCDTRVTIPVAHSGEHAVDVMILDRLGRLVASHLVPALQGGRDRIELDVSELAPGPYYYRIGRQAGIGGRFVVLR